MANNDTFSDGGEFVVVKENATNTTTRLNSYNKTHFVKIITQVVMEQSGSYLVTTIYIKPRKAKTNEN